MLFLIPIIVFLGFIAGYLLKRYIPEEKKLMQTYLYWSEKILLILIISYLLYNSFSFELTLIILAVLAILAGFLFREVYLFLALTLLSFNFIPAVLVFLFGLVKGDKPILKNAILFFLPFLLLLVSIKSSYFESFALGALISILVSKQ